jgi:ABC-type microcin C transport system permease subunit YejB
MEDNKVCYSHFGVWDFGHTGISIEQSIKEIKSGKYETILWPPHWTCCGRGWRDSCGKKHQHSGIPEKQYNGVNSDFDVEKEVESQMKFKKIVRTSWIQQINKFHKFDEPKVRFKVQKFCDFYRFKAKVSSAL